MKMIAFVGFPHKPKLLFTAVMAIFLGKNGGGVGRMLMPSKGKLQDISPDMNPPVPENTPSLIMSFQGVGQAMGAQNGYGGYPTKGRGK